MSTALEIILLERVENLGAMGDVVKVKPGYARNYLLPYNKALRATESNIAYFEAKKAELEKAYNAQKASAEKEAKALEGLTVTVIRIASEGGQLYGSVTARDIADQISAESDLKVSRGQVSLNDAFKTIGLFTVSVALHAEVKIDVTVNVARSEDEAEIQLKTGKALIAEEGETVEETAQDLLQKSDEAAEEIKEDFLEDSALEAEKQEAEDKAAEEKAAKEKAEAESAAAEAEAESNAEDVTEADESEEEKA